MKTRVVVFASGGACALLMAAATLHGTESAPGQIAGPASADPIARLASRIDKGEVRLEYDPNTGYIRSLLDRLDVRVDSQVLVFSKTSFQHTLISPKTPRAVFFNDTVAVGMVQGGEVYELIGVDPAQGLMFYTLTAKRMDPPQFTRRGAECAFCHLPGNHGAPGFVVASVLPDRDGVPFFSGSFFATTDHRTPFDQRWGGWYVTGTHGSQTHLGNAVAPDRDRPVDLDQTASFNVANLAGRFDASHYLSTHSDLVALMTLEHQAGLINRLFGIRAQHERVQRSTPNDASARNLEAAIDEMVAYLVFANEAPLQEPVAGTSRFAETFPQRGPRDSQGRSLRDFDLRTRLFRYPLSYVIYSDAFDRLPPSLGDKIYRKLYDVLTGRDTREVFSGLSADRRRAALEIVTETKSNLPGYWRLPESGH